MKYLKTKHERNSAKITGLTVLIIALLMFVVGAPYKEIPEEYGVAINFGEPSVVNNKVAADAPSKAEEIIDDTQEEVTDSEELTEDEPIEEEKLEEEVTKEEIKQAQAEIEALEKALEEEKAEAAAKEEVAREEAAREEAAKQEAAEKLLAQQEEEALKIKEAKEAAEKLEAEKKAKEKIEAKKRAEAKAKSEREAKDRADKAEAERIAKAKAEKEAREKAAREAKAEADRVAKAKAAKEAKAKADKAAAEKAAQAKADVDKKAAAAAAAAKNKTGGSTSNGFKLSQEGAIYPGCEGLDNTSRKQCMNGKIKTFFGNNFDNDLASTLGFSNDQSIKIYFKISKTGQIIDVRAKAAHPKLEEETKRVISLLPKIKPAMQQGKPTSAPYSTSVRFKAKQ